MCPPPAPGWAGQFPLAALSLLYALGGTLLTAWLVALILDRLLAARIGRQEPRPLAAHTPYVLLLEGELLAERLEQHLRLQKFQVVRVQAPSADGDPEAVAYRNLDRALRALRHCPCQAVGVLSNDLMANLAIALNCRNAGQGCGWRCSPIPSQRPATSMCCLKECR